MSEQTGKKALSIGDVREGLAKSLTEESRQWRCNTASDAQQINDLPMMMQFLHQPFGKVIMLQILPEIVPTIGPAIDLTNLAPFGVLSF